MKDRADAGERLVIWVFAYPRSLLAALWSPRSLLGARTSYCPPFVALFLSLTLYFLAGSLVHRVELGVPGNIGLPSFGVVIGTTTWLLLVLAAVHVVISRGFKLTPHPPLSSLALLSWPFVAGLGAYAALVALMVLFPETAVNAAAMIDSGIATLPDTWTFAMIWTHAVDTASALPVLAVFSWSLLNVVRVGFDSSVARSVTATVAAIVVGLLVTIAFLEFSGRITRQVYLWTTVPNR